MARLLLLLLGWSFVATPLFAQAPALPSSTPAASAPAQPSTASTRADLLLLFVRADAADALQQTPFLRTPGWSIYKATGPLVSKTGPVIYALFPRASPAATEATPAADVIKMATSYLAQRGANRLELTPFIDLGANAAPSSDAGAATSAPPAPVSRSAPPAPAASAGTGTTPGPAVSGYAIAQGEWQFTGDRGLLLLFVKAGKEAQFKGVLETLRSTLEKSPDPRRRQQARGWTVLKVNGNGPSGTIVFLSLLDPVVHGVNYAPSSVFSEALDGEALVKAYTDYADALSSLNLIDLEQVQP